jgi:serine/threonine protein kinase/tetratricopeptide (TPR) repeat protein
MCATGRTFVSQQRLARPEVNPYVGGGLQAGGMLQPSQPHNIAEPLPLDTPLDPIEILRAALRGHYDLEREIGQGAFATVYLARDLKHERKVAIKVLHADPTSDTGELRFIREIRLLARLQHPNILPLHDSGHVESLLYYVMPYVSGETLRTKIDRERQMSPDVACTIARDVADALAYAHAQGVVHRDIKPENILLSGGHPILADFGIARVIGLAGVRQLTRTGVGSPGTPAYMSPEQLIGEKELDGRSDTYSLGCVLFEMLIGRPPFTGKEGFAKRFTEAPPSARALRRDLPIWIDTALSRALAREPRDRFGIASDFAAALCQPHPSERTPRDRSSQEERRDAIDAVARAAHAAAAAAGVAGTVGQDKKASSPTMWTLPDAADFAPRQSTRGWLLRNRDRLLTVGAVLLITAIALLTASNSRTIRNGFGGAAPDTARFIVIPSQNDAAPGISGVEPATQKLYEAFTAWKGLRLVSDAAVDEAMRGEGRAPATLGEALQIARRLGAGKMIWTRGVGGSAHSLRAEMFDVAEGASTGRFTLLDDSSGSHDFARAAMLFAAIPSRASLAEDGDGLTTSFDAWTAYNRAHVALTEWNLTEAAKRFAQAAAADPGFPVADLWLAQVQAWTNPSGGDWRARAAKADLDSRLPSQDHLMAQALLALADQRYPAACEAYRGLTSMRAVEFIGAYGLGECQALDSLVVPSASSASGWRFRSSYRAAAQAYMRALAIEPRAHSIFSFGRLQRLIPASAARVRAGRSERPRSQIFVAYPSLEGPEDTLGFIPYPLSRFSNLPLSAIRTRNPALNANTEVLTQFTTNWIRRLPNDPAAFLARAEVLELSGDIGGEPFEQTEIVKALRQVRALTQDPQLVFYTTVREVWLRFKREEFGEARALADSLLNAHPHPTVSDAEALLPLAALTGKLEKTMELGRISQPSLPASDEELPPQVRYATSDLLINSALGICGDRIAALEKGLDDALVRYLPADRAKAMRDELMARPLSMTVHCTQGQSALRIAQPRMTLYQIQQAFAKGDKKAARSLLDFSAVVASQARPGDKSLDYTFQEAWVRAAIGDTAVAIGLLDNVLGALPSFSADNLKEVGAASAAAQTMILRSRLALARGDTKTARQWARAASLIWGGADAVVRATANEIWVVARNAD